MIFKMLKNLLSKTKKPKVKVNPLITTQFEFKGSEYQVSYPPGDFQFVFEAIIAEAKTGILGNW